jgi:hypothetical protein
MPAVYLSYFESWVSFSKKISGHLNILSVVRDSTQAGTAKQESMYFVLRI